MIHNLAKQAVSYNMVFFDPPYALQTIAQDIVSLMELDLLAKDVTIVCETSEEVELPDQIGWLAKTREQRYGITKIVIYKAGS